MKSSWAFILPAALLVFISVSARANSGDFNGGVAIGSSYAGIDAAPTNGLIVQGNVGIGTTSASNAVHVVSSSSSGNAPFITIENTSGATPATFGPGVEILNDVSGQHGYLIEQQQDSVGNLAISDPSSPFTQYFVLSQSGNVGIGTTSPSAPLHSTTGSQPFYTGGFNWGGIIANMDNVSGQSGLLVENAWSTSASNAFEVASDWNGSSNAFTPYFVVTGADYVGIGTGSPGYPLDVAGDARLNTNTPVLYLNGTEGSAKNIALYESAGYFKIDWVSNSNLLAINGANGDVGIANSSPSHLLHVGSSSASGIVMELQNSSGACTYNPGASSVTVSCSSDKRLKHDIEDSKLDGLAWIDDMRLRDFTINATGERKTGVVAQEVMIKHPEMVHQDSDGAYSVDEPDPWKLVKAIQEQQIEIDHLKQTIEQLKQQR